MVLNYKLDTMRSLDEICAVCGSSEEIEMHHVKHVRKDSVEAEGFTRLMSKLNRKQLPACRPCHKKIHKGLYDGMSLNEL
jgi:nicotine oxidoreductase